MPSQHKHGRVGRPSSGAVQWAPGLRMDAASVAARSEHTPLLAEEGEEQADPEQGVLLEGSAVTVEEVAEDVQLALRQHPREAIKWIEEFGAVRLGAFHVRASKIADLQESGSVRTFGSDRKDIDWEQEWMQRLGADKGVSTVPDHSALMEVEAYVVDIRNPSGADDEGILNPLLHHYADRICRVKVFSFPAVRKGKKEENIQALRTEVFQKAVLHFKWQTWAKQLLGAEVACYITWLICFQFFVLLVQDEDTKASLKEVAKTTSGAFTLIFEALAVLAMLPFMFIEYCTIVEYGLKDWFTAWNCLDCICYGVQIAVTIMHVWRLGIHSNSFSVLVALQVLLLWVRVQYYARCLQPTKNPFMETLRAVVSDVKWFLLLLLLTLWGFSCSFYILFRKDQDKKEFKTIWTSLSTCFSMMLGGFSLDLFVQSHNPVVATALLLIFVFTMSMVLLNCLVAIMCDACSKVNDSEGNVFLLARAQIIDELETTIPLPWRSSKWYPNYVHFLQVNREHALLQEVGGDEEDDAEQTSKQLERMEEKLEEARTQIATLMRLQEALVRELLPKQKAALLLEQHNPENETNYETNGKK